MRLKCHRQKKYFPILTQNCPSAAGYHFSSFMGPFIKWNNHKPVDNILYHSHRNNTKGLNVAKEVQMAYRPDGR